MGRNRRIFTQKEYRKIILALRKKQTTLFVQICVEKTLSDRGMRKYANKTSLQIAEKITDEFWSKLDQEVSNFTDSELKNHADRFYELISLMIALPR
ncbi:MAG: hypothetical protein WAQ28_01980 [Bacteroidia bacterium]